MKCLPGPVIRMILFFGGGTRGLDCNYGWTMKVQLRLLSVSFLTRRFDPVTDWQSFLTVLKTFLRAFFLLVLIRSTKVRNRLMKVFLMWTDSVTGSSRYLWLFLGSWYVIRNDTFHVFSIISASRENRSHNTCPEKCELKIIFTLNFVFGWAKLNSCNISLFLLQGFETIGGLLFS